MLQTLVELHHINIYKEKILYINLSLFPSRTDFVFLFRLISEEL